MWLLLWSLLTMIFYMTPGTTVNYIFNSWKLKLTKMEEWRHEKKSSFCPHYGPNEFATFEVNFSRHLAFLLSIQLAYVLWLSASWKEVVINTLSDYRRFGYCMFLIHCGPAKWWSLQFSSVAHLCPTLCDPMNRSTPALPVHHQLTGEGKTTWTGLCSVGEV